MKDFDEYIKEHAHRDSIFKDIIDELDFLRTLTTFSTFAYVFLLIVTILIAIDIIVNK